ncbi:hypothetical protein DFP72DRAFT_528283 [Ephemerocybe angulata]|uniref:Uncharacterized protein n=1 Tax=Ephemerocybe angulata TaxID=980116 RepID=A0A8H6ICX4_9AGAR|nr:hypothetical protein DFP72DRAFT_528283 [Tulosesus angulatus]
MVFSRLVRSVESFFSMPDPGQGNTSGKTRQAIPDRGEPETETETDAPPPYDGPNNGEGTSSRTLTPEEELYYAQLRQHDAAMQQYMAGIRGNAPFVLMPPVPPVPPPSMQAGHPTTRITMDWAPLPMTGWPPHLAMHRAPPPTIHVHRAPPPYQPSFPRPIKPAGPPTPRRGEWYSTV